MTQKNIDYRIQSAFKKNDFGELLSIKNACFKILFLSLYFIVFFSKVTFSQAPQVDKLNNIIPASPAVAEFQKYIDYPVSHTTGIPDISIPLYQINTGSLSLPISLSYHSSGFKVDEQTGVVGLGWVLNTGGMISRKIVNRPDELSSFPYPYITPSTLNQDLQNDFFYIGNMHREGDLDFSGSDGEYDVFYYNIGSTSGKFFLASNGAGKRKPISIPYDPISIKSNSIDFNSVLDYFEITDKTGIIYRFGKSSTDASTAIEEFNGATTAWFLKEIYSADRSTSIKFIYDVITRKETHRSDMWEVKDYRRSIIVGLQGMDDECINASDGLNYSLIQKTIEHPTVYYNSRILKEIQFTGGSMQFNYVTNTSNDVLLKTILVNNELGNTVKKFELQQDLFANLASSTVPVPLFKMSSLHIIDPITNKSENYDFTYNESTLLSQYDPIYNTNGVDYWGYYNGKTNNYNLIPSFQLNTDYGGFYTTSYNNRDADEVSMKTFILNKIKYPTGGTTDFEYEANRSNNLNVGGLRIKRIISKPFDAATPIIKKYVYGNAESGNGLLLQDPVNIHNFLTTSDYDYVCPLYPYEIWAKFRVRTISSDLNNGINLNSGNPVFYSEVAEYNEDLSAETNGKSVYVYEPPALYDFYLGTNTINTIYEEWKTNHLKYKTDFVKTTTAYVPVKREDYSYVIRNNDPLKCTKVVIKKYGISGTGNLWGWYAPGSTSWLRQYSLWNMPIGDPVVTYWTPGEVYNLVEYEYKAGVKLLSNKSTTFYTATGSIVTTENYTYGNDHNEPLTISTVNSKGETQIVNNKYPHDFISQQPYADMVNVKHIWSPVVEQSIFKNDANTHLKSVKSNFGFWDGNTWSGYSTNQILPQSIESRMGSNNYETRVLFNRYDFKSNLIEQQKINDSKEVYLWSYNSKYPVAKIVGSNYSTVSSLVSQAQIDAAVSSDASMRSVLNTLRTNLSGALVTTYTYSPLVGMTSQTDPAGRTNYYEYDGFGRLSLIRDHDQNILKKFEYQNQATSTSVVVTPVPCSITMNTGYSSPTSNISNNGTTVSGYLVFYPTSSPMTQGVMYQIATINGGCVPSGTRTYTTTSGGINWTVTVDAGGHLYVQMDYGSPTLNPYSTSSITLSYNL